MLKKQNKTCFCKFFLLRFLSLCFQQVCVFKMVFKIKHLNTPVLKTSSARPVLHISKHKSPKKFGLNI